jgi:hypothetical protein
MKNIKNYAARYYSNNQGDSEEFLKDLERIKYIQRFIKNRYTKDILQITQISNILITLSNLFKINPLLKILKCMVNKDCHSDMFSYLIFLGLPKNKIEYNPSLLRIITNNYERNHKNL